MNNEIGSRKIKLNEDVYCAMSAKFVGGDDNCDHDYDQEPNEKESYAMWKCTRCNGYLFVEVWG